MKINNQAKVTMQAAKRLPDVPALQVLCDGSDPASSVVAVAGDFALGHTAVSIEASCRQQTNWDLTPISPISPPRNSDSPVL